MAKSERKGMRQVPMKSGWEYDALTKGGRRVHKFRAGVRAYTKRAFRRRERRGLDRDARLKLN